MNWSDYNVNREYREEMMRRAEDYRRSQSLRGSSNQSSSRVYRRLVVRMGRQMVEWGLYLVRSQGENLNTERQTLQRSV
jgi:hypothetical protein